MRYTVLVNPPLVHILPAGTKEYPGLREEVFFSSDIFTPLLYEMTYCCRTSEFIFTSVYTFTFISNFFWRQLASGGNSCTNAEDGPFLAIPRVTGRQLLEILTTNILFHV